MKWVLSYGSDGWRYKLGIALHFFGNMAWKVKVDGSDFGDTP
jgi:hypothetical protein